MKAMCSTNVRWFSRTSMQTVRAWSYGWRERVSPIIQNTVVVVHRELRALFTQTSEPGRRALEHF